MSLQQPNYTMELLLSETNLGVGAASVLIGALISVPLGIVGVLPVLAFIAGEAIALMYIPSSATFKNSVDRKFRNAKREADISKYVATLENYPSTRGNAQLKGYNALATRIESLHALAKDSATAVSVETVERIADTLVTYLGLWLAFKVLDARKQATDAVYLDDQIREIKRELDKPHDNGDLKKLQKALQDYSTAKESYAKIDIRKHSLEASMVALVSKVEEMYQYVLSQPTNPDIATTLEESLSKLQVEEELNEELTDISAALGSTKSRDSRIATAV